MRRHNAKLWTTVGPVGLSLLTASGLALAEGASRRGEIHLYEADTGLAGNRGPSFSREP